MALIKCDECGNKVSTKAAACPKCGNPISEETGSKKPNIIIHGYTENSINSPVVDVFIGDKKIGSVHKEELLNLYSDSDCELTFKSGIRSTSISIKANKTNEIQLSWDRVWGKLKAYTINNETVNITENKESTKKSSVKKGNKYTNSSISTRKSFASFFACLVIQIFSVWLLYNFRGTFLAAIGWIGIIGLIMPTLYQLLKCTKPIICYICPKCEKEMAIHSVDLVKGPYDTYETKCGYCFSKIVFDFNEKTVTAEENKDN